MWFRRALRTDDHPALLRALLDAPSVVPLLCLSDDPAYAVLSHRRRFLQKAITSLDASLRTAGTMLHVRTGDPVTALPAAVQAYGADAVYAVELSDPVAIERDARIERALKALRIPFVRFPDRVLRGPHEVLTGAKTPFRVYTPYRNAWMSGADEIAPPAAAPKRIPPVELAPGSCALDRLGWEPLGKSVAKEAHARLRQFMSGGVGTYATMRDLPGNDGTSKMSPYIAVGAISIRRVFHAARQACAEASGAGRHGSETFINELVWREFYSQALVHWPHAIKGPFRPEFAEIPWSRDGSAFERWKDGTTGYPVVDAAMRQLREEGWMHNRARMIVASFLTKDLHLHWQWGERYFLSMLMDADQASNNGGWQWTAGTGTDASPWFRIFNPVLQGKKFDPDGMYVRRYVPELARIPTAAIHEPWRLNRQEQEAAGCVIGLQYPAPMVDHAEARARTMAIYRIGDRAVAAPARQRARTLS